MALFYHRPAALQLIEECQQLTLLKRRRPINKDGHIIKFRSVKKNDLSDDEQPLDDAKLNGNLSNDDGKDNVDSPSNVKKSGLTARNSRKLDDVLKRLAEKMSSSLALNGNGTNGHHAPPTSYSLASHIVSTINSHPHQHVSPRKRILRELEKVSLEDSKRSRPKHQLPPANGASTNGNSVVTSSASSPLTNGILKHEKVPPTVSRPISSYSITSLLGHNSTTASTGSSAGCYSFNDHPTNDSNSTSHHQSRLSLNSPPESPSSSLHNQNNKRKSPNVTPPGAGQHHYRSPDHSPSPEHHAFQKYRPTTITPTSGPSTSSPYSSSYHSPNYMRGSPSPHHADNNNRLRTTTGNYQNSPSQHHHQNHSCRDSSLSPNVDLTGNNRNTPTNGTSTVSSTPATTIRTVPKKTAALRHQFSSSPTMESKKTSAMDVDSLIRPSALIAPPMPAMSQHPMYPYMYPQHPISYLPPGVAPYYHSFYNPAMMAYRFPSIHPSVAAAGLTPAGYPMSPISTTQSNSSSSIAHSPPTQPSNSNGQRTSSSPAHHYNHHSPYVPTSPWNPIPLTNHSINDGNLIPKVKDEPSSGKLMILFSNFSIHLILINLFIFQMSH